MKIYTYHSVVRQLSIEDETRLIMLWKAAWERRGYEPVVLNEFIARQNKLFNVLDDKIIHKLPSINPISYDRACYLRWLAMVEVNGGLMADYDVMPYADWTPKNKTDPTPLVGYQKHVPSLVHGSRKAYLNIVNAFLNYQLQPDDLEQGKPHISDMLILHKSHMPMRQLHHVKNYGEDGWDDSPLVHWSTSSMSPKLLPRWKHIPTVRNPLT